MTGPSPPKNIPLFDLISLFDVNSFVILPEFEVNDALSSSNFDESIPDTSSKEVPSIELSFNSAGNSFSTGANNFNTVFCIFVNAAELLSPATSLSLIDK